MKLIVAVPLAAIIVVALSSLPLAIQNTPYGVYNDEDKGARHLVQSGRAEGIIPTLDHNGTSIHLFHGAVNDLRAGSDALLIVSPSRVYSEQEVGDLRRFLEEGGRAIVADRLGTGRQLVQDLDVGVQIAGVGIYTPGYNRTPDYPVGVSTGLLPRLPAEVIFNQPGVVLGNGSVVVAAPEFTWLDYNGNQRPDLTEPRAPYPLIQLVHVGAGELLVVGDPNLFTQEMDVVNRQTVQVLLEWLAPPGRVLLWDMAHHASADPLRMGAALAGTTPLWLDVVMAILGVGAIALAAMRFRLRRAIPIARRPLLIEPRRSKAEEAVLAELET